jgi:hypothetical protein
MDCCVEGKLTRQSARTACRDAIYDAARTALEDDVFGVLVDAVPTLGKSRTVATIAEDLSAVSGEARTAVTVLTHRKETRDQIEEWAAEAGLEPHQLPRLDDDCPSARGDHGQREADDMRKLRRRGLSPGMIHANPRYEFSCSNGQTCPYTEGWEDCRSHEVLIGHPTHAYVPEVVRDRLVVFDEDPEEAFLTKFDSSAVHRIVKTYLDEDDGIPWTPDDGLDSPTSLDGLRSYARWRPDEQVEAAVDALRSSNLFDDTELASTSRGHGSARALVLTTVEWAADGPNHREMGNGVHRVELGDRAVAVYHEGSGGTYLRRPPDLSTAAGVVGLDGTPILRMWEGRLGCPPDQEIEYRRVLCEEHRQEYLWSTLGYQIYQTSTHIKPYSSSEYVRVPKDTALIEAVYRETGVEPAVITTKGAEQLLREEWRNVQASAHYGDIKGSNAFTGEDISVGIVLGSRHPGDDEIARIAGLNGDSLTFPKERRDRGKDLSYGVTSRGNEPDDPYLWHFREHRVVQAILRFGRVNGATVYVHTGAVPDWILTGGPLEEESSVFLRKRVNGEREVLEALADGSELTAFQVESRTSVCQSTVYKRLKALAALGMVRKRGEKQPHRWHLVDADTPRGDHVYFVVDQWYVRLPETSNI